LSTGLTRDRDLCRKTVLDFMQVLSWRVNSVEVRLWTALGAPHGVCEWQTDGTDYETLADRVAQFVTGSDVAVSAIVLARRSTDPLPRRRRFPYHDYLGAQPGKKKL
jgi:hypothetical protein